MAWTVPATRFCSNTEAWAHRWSAGRGKRNVDVNQEQSAGWRGRRPCAGLRGGLYASRTVGRDGDHDSAYDGGRGELLPVAAGGRDAGSHFHGAQAVTKHRNVQIFFNVASNTVEVTEIVAGSTNWVHAPAALPPGIMFTNLPAVPTIAFSPMGSAGGVGTSTIQLIEKTAGYNKSASKVVQCWAKITVWLLTGVTEVEQGFQ